MKTQLTFVHALSPLHAGIGQGAGVIDLPIAREKATSLPFLPGSSLKGALRTRALQPDMPKEYLSIFGPDPEDIESRASSVLFSDQRLLLLPVRSVAGTFAWVTSPYVLQRFVRELKELPAQFQAAPSTIPPVTKSEQCILPQGHNSTLVISNKVYLEDFDLTVQNDADLTEWANWLSTQIFSNETTYWQNSLKERLCLVHDDLFHFLCQHATEVITRIKLKDDTKTVDDTTGGLWYEEALPTESILSGIVVIMRVKESTFSDDMITTHLNTLTEKTLQLGGMATVGRGMCRVRLV